MCNLIFKLNFKKNKQLAQTMGFVFACMTGDHFHGNFLKIKFGCELKKGSEISVKRLQRKATTAFSIKKGERIRFDQFRSTIFDQQQKIHPKHSDVFFGAQPFLQSTSANNFLTQKNIANQKNCLWQN